jgi:xanthine dehydrogenase small subunit
MRDHLFIYLNGRSCRVAGDEAFLTLSEFLRGRQRLTGTKVVCAEGDCGACAVLVGRLTPEGSRLAYAAVTSCIQFMFQLDCAHVVTIEGLSPNGWHAHAAVNHTDAQEADRVGMSSSRPAEHGHAQSTSAVSERDNGVAMAPSPLLNPIQQAMVTCHGAQCGFCTPGFVVSLYDLMHDGRPVDSHAVRRALVGNLCRCTGYDSIIRAALETDRAALQPIEALYPSDAIIAALAPALADEVQIRADQRHFYKPTTIEQAIAFRAKNPDCAIVSGATDVGVQRNKGVRQLVSVISTVGISPLRNVEHDSGSLRIGAGVTLTELERATADVLPELSRFLAWFGSPLIKNAGTLAGNVVNASPIGDTIPALFVLGAQLEIAGPSGKRSVPIEQFCVGYRRTILTDAEILTAIRIPLPAPGEIFKLYKISRRKDLDIASFGAAIWMRRTGGRIDDLRIAYGGVGPTVLRMARTEAVLRGRVGSLELFEAAALIAREEVTPLTDVRGSADYRRALAGNVLLRFCHELENGRDDTNGDGHPPTSPRPTSRLHESARSPEGAP